MAAWIKVFLRKPLDQLSVADIEKGIGPADWWTLGEHIGLEEEDVDAFMGSLRWSEVPLQFRADGQRPVQISIDADPEEVAVLVGELVQYTDLTIPRRVRKRLASVTAVVMIDMGVHQLRTMNETVAFEIAYWLAEKYDGVILSDDHQWYDHDKNRREPIHDEVGDT